MIGGDNMKRKCQRIYEQMTKEQFIEKLLKAGYSRSFIDHYFGKYDCKFKEPKKERAK